MHGRTTARMKRGFALIVLALAVSACTPVSVWDPGHWDPTVYCATVRPPDPWCKAHGH
jgi:hypothetical protein